MSFSLSLVPNESYSMNTLILKGVGYSIGRVIAFHGDRGFGFAICQNEKFYFHIKTGKAIIAGGKHPEFLENQPAIAPRKGDMIVADVGQGARGFFASIWGLESELVDAEGVLKLRTNPNPAPEVQVEVPLERDLGSLEKMAFGTT